MNDSITFKNGRSGLDVNQGEERPYNKSQMSFIEEFHSRAIALLISDYPLCTSNCKRETLSEPAKLPQRSPKMSSQKSELDIILFITSDLDFFLKLYLNNMLF